MKLQNRRVLDYVTQFVIGLIPDFLILLALYKIVFDHASIIVIFIAYFGFFLARFVFLKILQYFHWLVLGRQTQVEMILNTLVQNGYPKIPRNNRSAWDYLKDIYEDPNINVDVRLNACSLATDLDATKVLGVIPFMQRLASAGIAIDSYVGNVNEEICD